MIIVNGWLMYTHHYTARFEEPSLFHSFTLFFFLIGMAASVVNASFETITEFSLSVALQRAAILIMMIPVYVFIQRARTFVVSFCLFMSISLLCFLIAAISPQW
uniref:Sugar phosphate transporter domain-containing protein n=1 Tax=Timspurckia oligopyrenoides TaxID=708627 RepID=A0A7S0ZIH1_9RHOD|mmetsp:Transcript_6368/g.11358  ORF Transcript_6368/g.11358 Transcript_6368/m.11358 type:complete len:104 (+) Transcript_6368:254-565(+)